MKAHRKRYYLRRGRQSRRDEIIVARMNREHNTVEPYTVAWLHGWKRAFARKQRAVDVVAARILSGRRTLMGITS